MSIKTIFTKKLFVIHALALSFFTPLGSCAALLELRDDGTEPGYSLRFGDEIETEINATKVGKWVNFDLDAAYFEYSEEDQPVLAEDWDLSFQRFMIKLNGGDSGDRQVALQAFPDQSWEQVDGGSIEMQNFFSDQADSQGDPDDACRPVTAGKLFAFLDSTQNPSHCWFKYDDEHHTLAVRDIVYIVKSSEDNYFKIKMLSYYSEAGSAAVIRFRFRLVEQPE